MAFPVAEDEILGFYAGEANYGAGAASQTGKYGSFSILVQLQFILNGEACDGIPPSGRISFFLFNEIGRTTRQAKAAFVALGDFIVG
jgi:hypothetical protein